MKVASSLRVSHCFNMPVFIINVSERNTVSPIFPNGVFFLVLGEGYELWYLPELEIQETQVQIMEL